MLSQEKRREHDGRDSLEALWRGPNHTAGRGQGPGATTRRPGRQQMGPGAGQSQRAVTTYTVKDVERHAWTRQGIQDINMGKKHKTTCISEMLLALQKLILNQSQGSEGVQKKEMSNLHLTALLVSRIFKLPV